MNIESVSHSYGRVRALDDVTFAIEPGITGLIGVNGAGKTTLLKLILGILPLQKGRILFDGSATHPISREMRARIGYVPEVPAIDTALSITENLQFFIGILKAEGYHTSDVDDTLRMVGLESVRSRRGSGLSRGMQQRLTIAQTLVTTRDFFVLDEPMAHLDPLGRIEVARLIQSRAKEGATIVISTHILSDLEICDRIAVLDRGQLLYAGPVKELRDRYAALHSQWTIETDHPQELAALLKSSLDGVVVENISDLSVSVTGVNAGMKSSLFRILSQSQNIDIRSFIDGLPRLEDLLLRILEEKKR